MATDTQLKRRQENEAFRKMPVVRAMLDGIAAAEGADWGTLVYDKPGTQTIRDFSQHPGITRDRIINGKRTKSSAAGRFQIIKKTWNGAAVRAQGLTDFTPQSQELAAIELLRQRGALDDLLAGNLKGAMEKAGKEWAGIPNSSLAKAHNQNSAKEAAFLSAYQRSLQKNGVPDAVIDTFVRPPNEQAPKADRRLAAAELAVPTEASRAHSQITTEDSIAAIVPQKFSMFDQIEALVGKQAETDPDESSLIERLTALEAERSAGTQANLPVLENPSAGLEDMALARIRAQADAAREEALAAVTGLPTEVSSIQLPGSIEASISRILGEELNGAA